MGCDPSGGSGRPPLTSYDHSVNLGRGRPAYLQLSTRGSRTGHGRFANVPAAQPFPPEEPHSNSLTSGADFPAIDPGLTRDCGMRWGRLRPWLALIGPLIAVVVVTAAPAGVQAGELPWPKWLVAGLVAAGGVLVAVGTPLLKVRTDALATRATGVAERAEQAEGVFEVCSVGSQVLPYQGDLGRKPGGSRE